MTSRRRGGALLITVGVLASLVAILAAAATSQRVSFQAISNRLQARRARLMAEAGIQRALVVLSTQSPTETTLQDDWATLGQMGADRFVVGADSFRMQIVDASALVNLNVAPEEQLARLPLTQEQIDSLLDWREANLQPRSDGGKDEYYNQLATPYNAKLQGLSTFDELMLVKGFTAQTLYEPQVDVSTTAQPLPQKDDGTEQTLFDLCTVDSISANVGANGQQKPNFSSATLPQLLGLGLSQQQAQQLLLARPTNYAGILQRIQDPNLQRRLVSTFSFSSAATLNGKIDVNTAGEAVLETVPNLPPDVSSAIVSRQGTPFTDLSDLFDVPGFAGPVAQQTIDMLATNSQTFIVRSIGTAGQTKVSLEALVSVTADGAQVRKLSLMPYADMASRWVWLAEPSSDTVLKEAPGQ